MNSPSFGAVSTVCTNIKAVLGIVILRRVGLDLFSELLTKFGCGELKFALMMMIILWCETLLLTVVISTCNQI